jgi:hypothetical protein
VSTSGGEEPQWGADGSEILYLDPDGNMVTVPVEMSPAFKAGLPQTLFDAGLFQFIRRNRYSVTDDGERFLLLSPIRCDSVRPISVVLNWTAGLEP